MSKKNIFKIYFPLFFVIFELIIIYLFSFNYFQNQTPLPLIVFLLLCSTSALFLCIKMKYNSDAFCFLLIFSLLIIHAFFGINTTDPGYTLTKAWNFNLGNFSLETDYIWGSNYLISKWLSLGHFPSLLWLYSGYALQTAIIIFFSNKTVSLFCRQSTITKIIISITSAGFITIRAMHSYYGNLPACIIIIASYLYWYGIKNKKRVMILFAGIAIGFSIHCRLPQLLFLILPFCLYIYQIIINSISKKQLNFYPLIMTMGILAGLSLGFLILAINNNATTYIKVLRQLCISVFSESSKKYRETSLYESSNVLRRFLSECAKTLILTFSLIFSIALSNFAISRKKLKNFYSLAFTLTIEVIALFAFLPDYFLYIILANIICLFFFYISNNFKSEGFFETLAVILFSIFIALSSSIGSDTGFRAIFTSGAVVFPLCLSLSLSFYCAKIKDFSAGQFNISANNNFFSFLSKLLSLILFIVSLITFSTWKPIRGGCEHFSDLKTSDKILSIKGVYSKSSRIDCLEELYIFCKNQNNWQESPVLVLNSAPLLYPILNKTYEIKNTWGPWIFLNSSEEFFKLLNEYNSKREELYIILAISAQRTDSWPDYSLPTVMNGYEERYLKTVKWLKEEKYEKIFTNAGFAVYRKSQ